MTTRHADYRSVVESLRKVAADDAPDEGRLRVYKTDARMVALTDDELDERNLRGTEATIDSELCTIDWEASALGGTHLDLHFHEKVVGDKFELRPAGVSAIDPQQATSPYGLSEDLRTALLPLEKELDAVFSFKGVQAASMASGGHFTDFEFEYSIDQMKL